MDVNYCELIRVYMKFIYIQVHTKQAPFFNSGWYSLYVTTSFSNAVIYSFMPVEFLITNSFSSLALMAMFVKIQPLP